METANTSSAISLANLFPFVITAAISLLIVPAAVNPTVVDAVVKILPIISLIVFFKQRRSEEKEASEQDVSKKSDGVEKPRLLPALFLSLVGDVFLIWYKDTVMFLCGVAVFGLAQLSYSRAFGFEVTSWAVGGMLYAFAAIATYVVLHGAPTIMRTIIPFYACLLATTVWRTIDRAKVQDGRKNWQRNCLVLGSVTFLLSDLCIGMFKFQVEIPDVTAQTIIVGTYYLAQFLLVISSV